MTYHGPKVRLSRRMGVALTPKAAKIMERRPNPPGQHGKSGRGGEDSDYKKQLNQKQLLRFQYDIRETQMRRYYQMALKSRGNSAERLIQLLESRLDAIVLRAGFAKTIYAARQYVSHGHFTVNNEKVNISSYMIKPGDEVAVCEKSQKLNIFQELGPAPVSYLEVAPKELKIKLLRHPQAVEVPIICEVARVIEFYSR